MSSHNIAKAVKGSYQLVSSIILTYRTSGNSLINIRCTCSVAFLCPTEHLHCNYVFNFHISYQYRNSGKEGILYFLCLQKRLERMNKRIQPAQGYGVNQFTRKKGFIEQGEQPPPFLWGRGSSLLHLTLPLQSWVRAGKRPSRMTCSPQTDLGLLSH